MTDIHQATELQPGKTYLIEVDADRLSLEDIHCLHRDLLIRGVSAVLVPMGAVKVLDAVPAHLEEAIARILRENKYGARDTSPPHPTWYRP